MRSMAPVKWDPCIQLNDPVNWADWALGTGHWARGTSHWAPRHWALCTSHWSMVTGHQSLGTRIGTRPGTGHWALVTGQKQFAHSLLDRFSFAPPTWWWWFILFVMCCLSFWHGAPQMVLTHCCMVLHLPQSYCCHLVLMFSFRNGYVTTNHTGDTWYLCLLSKWVYQNYTEHTNITATTYYFG
jgi:hypothetical protein